jgi:uncharacterized protein (TIGR03437 family)
MFFPRRLLLAALCLTPFVCAVEAQTIFVVPSTGGQPTSVFSGDPFALRNSIAASNVGIQALSVPAGTKTYLIQRSGSDTVVVVDANTNAVTQRISLSTNGEAAALTPNGQRLLVTAGTLHIIDTGSDTEVGSVAVGSTPTDVAVSLDGTRAFVLTPSANTLTAVDLATNQVTGTPLALSGGLTSVETGPNGLIYVTATNRLFEIDPRTNTLRIEIPVIGRPGQTVFTANGRYAVSLNETPVTGSSVFVFDLISKTLAGTIAKLSGSFGDILLNKLIAAGNDRVFATAQSGGVIYQVTPSTLAINAAGYSGIDQLVNVLAASASNQLPSPRYLYAATPTSLYRFDISSSLLTPSGQIGVTSQPIGVLSASVPSTISPTSVLSYNLNQTLPSTGGTALPLVIRALDAAGNPVAGAPVTFLTTGAGLSFSNVSPTTNIEGFAQATASVPAGAGVYTITATAGGAAGPSATFTLTVASTGAGGTGGVSIVSGNGQIVVEQFQVQDPMVIVVRDPNGAPVANADVTFQLTQGAGTLSPSTFSGAATSTLSCNANVCTTKTDSQGMASVGFVSTLIPAGLSYSISTITASSGSSQVSFSLVTVIRTVQGQLAPPPSTELLKPLDTRIINAQAGSTIPGAIQVRVIAAAGGQAGQAIPGVGLTIITPDATQFPSARCAGGTVLTDASGIATCDLVVGGRVGTDVPIRVNIGSFRDVGNLILNVTPGPPAVARIVQGNNQGGNPGQRLPLALVAEIADAGGNILSGVPATWSVISGSATLSNTVNTTDGSGRVSTLVTLGSTAGNSQIRVTAGSATATFTVTTNVAIGGITKVSGDMQTAQISTGFAAPLVVSVTDDKGQPVAGIRVDFTATGGTLGAANATTDANGRAQVTVTAGATAGPVTVTASVPNGPSTVFSLTARLPGPVFTSQSFYNAASNQPGISPGSLAIITVSGVAPALRGCNVANNFGIGALPLTLASVRVIFGATPAPIAYICNIDGRETVAVQVPFEMATGAVPVTIFVGEGNTVVNNVQIQAFSPGIFEHMIDGRRYAVLQHADGSFVSNTNRAQRGERLRLYVTGLGQTNPGTGTNRPGTIGQAVAAPVVIGVNNAGVNVISAETLPGVVGAYVVTFEVPAEAPSGDTVLNVAAGEQGSAFYSQASVIAIQ